MRLQQSLRFVGTPPLNRRKNLGMLQGYVAVMRLALVKSGRRMMRMRFARNRPGTLGARAAPESLARQKNTVRDKARS